MLKAQQYLLQVGVAASTFKYTSRRGSRIFHGSSDTDRNLPTQSIGGKRAGVTETVYRLKASFWLCQRGELLQGPLAE